MKLFEINAELERLLMEIESRGGEVTPLEEQMLEGLQLAYDEKIAGVVAIIRQEEDRVESCKREIERVKSLREAAERKVEWLRQYLGTCLNGANYDGGTFKLGWRKSESVECDVALLPECYIKTKVEKVADKIQLKADIKSGATVPGAYIITKNNLQIK